MTDAQKLEVLVRKAIDGGWDAFGSESQAIDVEDVQVIDGELQPELEVDKPGLYVVVHRHHGTYSVPEVLFNHDFARALFGEELTECANRCLDDPNLLPKFEVKMQQAVISDNPIDYYYKEVFGDGHTTNS